MGAQLLCSPKNREPEPLESLVAAQQLPLHPANQEKLKELSKIALGSLMAYMLLHLASQVKKLNLAKLPLRAASPKEPRQVCQESTHTGLTRWLWVRDGLGFWAP